MLSIHISSTEVFLVEGTFKNGRVRVSGYDAVETPEGSVKNGLIMDMGKLSDALRESIKRKGFKSKKAIVTISSSAVVTREVTVPDTKDREMRVLLVGEIEQNASTKQEYILDYVVLEKSVVDGSPVCRVLCIVVPKVMVESYWDLLEKQLGLKAVSMDVLNHTVYKFICKMPEFEGDAVLIVAIDKDEVSLVLAEGDTKLFYRTVPISTARDVMNSEFILSSFGGNDMLTANAKRDQIISTASENISKLIQFQHIKNKEKPVRQIFVCGGLSDDETLAADIGGNLELPVTRLGCPSFVECPEGLLFSQYVNAISALIAL